MKEELWELEIPTAKTKLAEFLFRPESPRNHNKPVFPLYIYWTTFLNSEKEKVFFKILFHNILPAVEFFMI